MNHYSQEAQPQETRAAVFGRRKMLANQLAVYADTPLAAGIEDKLTDASLDAARYLPSVKPDHVPFLKVLGSIPLFHVDRGQSDSTEDRTFTALGGAVVSYKGPSLGMFDAHVFLAALHLTHGTPVGSTVATTRRAILMDAGLGVNAVAYARLDAALDNLSRAWVKVTSPSGAAWRATLLGECATSKGAVELRLSPRIIAAFTDGAWCQASLPAYRTINPGLASRMAMLLDGFPKEFHKDLPALMKIVGSTSATQAEFAKLLRAALPKLKAAGAIKSWNIKRDVVGGEHVLMLHVYKAGA
jgi:hypothetical protein